MEETYYSKHKDYILERQKKYNQENKDKIKEYQQNYWYTVKKAKVQANRPLRPQRPKKERVPKPKKPKAPVLPTHESILESIKEPEPIIESNITYINGPIIVSFD